ncbi:hypothetical protein HKD37_15G043413 [Glycine soja]
MAAQLIHDRVVMECLEGVWETLEGNERCQFRGTIRLTTTSLVHLEEPARTIQQPVEWILPTPTPYRLVEPVQLIEDDEDSLPDVDSPEDIMAASEADSIEESGPGGTANSEDSSS